MILPDLGNTCVIGLQWGDEGKGKVVDLLVSDFDVAVRYAGGANAGHTVVAGGEKFALHQLPSGILHPGILSIIGGGTVIDPAALIGEIESLRPRGVTIADNLRISNRAHVVFPYHRIEDVVAERGADGLEKLGTTSRGIGPCYADKVTRRWGIRICDLFDRERLLSRLERIVAHRTAYLRMVYEAQESFDAATLTDEYIALGEQLEPFVCDTTTLLHESLRAGRRILFEGAQGALLDIDHGTYPFVTSSSAAGFASGAGVPPSAAQSMVGVLKAYTTRVGTGPFPSELTDSTGEQIRSQGGEYGTTTGRPRRCGWFDAVAAGYGARLTGPTHLAVMHLDTLSGLPELKICVGYRHKGVLLNEFPADAYILEEVEPVFETLPGWETELGSCRSVADLPQAARDYLAAISQRLETPVRLVGVGPGRDQVIVIDDGQ